VDIATLQAVVMLSQEAGLTTPQAGFLLSQEAD
jgi:hypothetical protein